MSPDAVADELTRCSGWLEAAIRRSEGETDAREVVAEVMANRAQLWAGDRSCFVTQLHNVEGEIFIFGWVGGGDLAELLAMRPVVESWGKQQGATSARMNGRLGWSKVLKQFGYAEVGGELRKALS